VRDQYHDELDAITALRDGKAKTPFADPKLGDVVRRVAEAVDKGGVARLALPMNHPAFPRNAAQLRELGVGYTNCAPAPEVRMLRSMQAQVAEARAQPA